MFDTTPYPAPEEADGCKVAKCLADRQIRSEIRNQINARNWPFDLSQEPQAQYLVYTPAGVTVCNRPGSCTISFQGSGSLHGFCAYHSQFPQGETSSAGGYVATYSVLPDVPIYAIPGRLRPPPTAR